MITSVEGIYCNGRVELVESPNNVLEGARVIVTFVPSNTIDLASQGIDQAQAEVLRTSLGPPCPAPRGRRAAGSAGGWR